MPRKRVNRFAVGAYMKAKHQQKTLAAGEKAALTAQVKKEHQKIRRLTTKV